MTAYFPWVWDAACMSGTALMQPHFSRILAFMHIICKCSDACATLCQVGVVTMLIRSTAEW